MTKDDKDAKVAWDGQIEPEPPHGGDWFWGGDPPPAHQPLARDASTTAKGGDKPRS